MNAPHAPYEETRCATPRRQLLLYECSDGPVMKSFFVDSLLRCVSGRVKEASHAITL